MYEFAFVSEKNKERYLRLIAPVANLLSRMKIHPNILTLCGLVLSLITGLIYSSGSFFWAAWVLVLAGTCDVLDGRLARQTGRETRFGALFDSALDRFGELFIFMGLAWHFSGGILLMAAQSGHAVEPESPWAVVFILMAMGGSFMVSYTKARAEGLGIRCDIGWMQRPERITLLVIGSLLGSLPSIGPLLMKVTLLLFAILTNVTAIQRILYVKHQDLEGDGSR